MNPLQLRRVEMGRLVRAGGWDLSRHAVDRMIEMGVGPADVLLILREGSSWPQGSRVSGQPGTLHWHPDRPEWAVVTSVDDPGLVITVVFRSIEEYERDGAVKRPKS